jgi:pentatricopeptide repeat protein
MVKQIGGDVEVFGMIVRKLADKNRLQEALALLDEAVERNIPIRERSFVYSIFTIMFP